MRHVNERSAHNRRYRWLILIAVFLALIALPFILLGGRVDTWTNTFVQSASNHPDLVAIVAILVLAADILIPTPANEINMAAGYFLGFTGGFVVSSIGRTLSAVVGYWLGWKFGRPGARRLVGDNELARLEQMYHRLGDWAIIISRPIPLLAEASVVFAGIVGMPRSRFLILTTIGNLSTAAVFSAFGAYLSRADYAFVLACLAAVLVSVMIALITSKLAQLMNQSIME